MSSRGGGQPSVQGVLVLCLLASCCNKIVSQEADGKAFNRSYIGYCNKCHIVRAWHQGSIRDLLGRGRPWDTTRFEIKCPRHHLLPPCTTTTIINFRLSNYQRAPLTTISIRNNCVLKQGVSLPTASSSPRKTFFASMNARFCLKDSRLLSLALSTPASSDFVLLSSLPSPSVYCRQRKLTNEKRSHN